ncbi:hypothetical protein ACJIZ3_003160 [Penstemon smallii]|uniref:rhamnogalacturonan endolyase n=1 Tax=Penstemon smallii TaxID=265156 RepID=A0ABD3U9M1_9LAMI
MKLRLHVQDRHVVMDNGILKVTLSKPDGIVTGIRYNGIGNLLEIVNEESNRGFVMLHGSSGFYTYAIYEHLEGWPGFNLDETRIVFKLRKDMFHYMAMADNRQRYMPLPDDRLPGRGQPLDYPEAILLFNPIEPQFKGEVDDKYQYSCENKDNKVHGWICDDPSVGFWQITPSNEFKTGGPLKQDLTSHVGPTTLNALKEVVSWPYSFPESADFQSSAQRGNVRGRLLLRDRISILFFPFKRISDDPQKKSGANGAYVGLAPPGDIGSWQREGKGYQFWTRADEEGYFSINDIHVGDYSLYAWIPGFIGDYKNDEFISITPGCDINTGDLVFEPPRDGPTLWEIGTPDRSAREFYVPDPNPKYINKLYVDHPDKFRQYGLWERYAELYPNADLVYTIGKSNYGKDWFFAHVTRKKDDKTYESTTWQIKFKLDTVKPNGTYRLRLALASAAQAILEVVMDNGILNVTLSKPDGIVTGIRYNGLGNLLEIVNEESNRGFVMLHGSSGFYTYAIYERLEGWPGFNLDETRIVFKLRKDKFHYMAMADNRQRYMPLPDDRLPGRGQPLDYPEAVLIFNPIEPQFKGEVDDKYQYSCENKDNKVHGWICDDPSVGFWQITPSNEFKTGGPLKQDLTSHVGPTTLNALKEVVSWPYSFPESADFQSSAQRGNVRGRLLHRDRRISDDPQKQRGANGAYVGLAPPGDIGSWQREGKGYQFWTRADEEGYFSINNIHIGHYNLYAWIPGFIGDYKNDEFIRITPGSKINTGDLVYEPPRDGPILWEIGTPDRSAREFYVPDPNPKYINKLYVDHPDKFRQYGLWKRYAELYPNADLVYTIGKSNYAKDWFFAHVTRKKDDKTYKSTTWQIKFKLDTVKPNGTYRLRLALASAAEAILEVRINEKDQNPAQFSSGLIGKDNAIARHGIHGLYWLFNVEIRGTLLDKGDNTIYLTQANATNPFQGVMYDYIRFEAPY